MSVSDIAGEVLVVILGGGRGSRLEPLTRLRSKPAVPVAGKYRLIDITISNAIHSGMERMFVLTQYNSVSLHRHIVRTYKFDIFSRGYVQILAAQQTKKSMEWFQGTADAVRQNIDIITETRCEHVLILSGDHIYRMDYRRMLSDHLEADADMTLAVQPCSEDEIWRFGAVRVDEAGMVQEFREKPGTPEARHGMAVDPALLAARGVASDRPYLASMGIYLFRKERLIEALQHEGSDFGHHVIPSMVGQRRLASHFFDGYWRDIGSIRAFYETHMDLVQPDPPFHFYDPDWSFYTHPRYLPGSVLAGCGFNNAMLSGGAIIRDSQIDDSIIGIRARVNRAAVRQSYIMGVEHNPTETSDPPIGVGEGTEIEGAIVDLNARIGRNCRLVNDKGLTEAEGEGWFIREGVVVVEKNARVPDGTVIS